MNDDQKKADESPSSSPSESTHAGDKHALSPSSSGSSPTLFAKPGSSKRQKKTHTPDSESGEAGISGSQNSEHSNFSTDSVASEQFYGTAIRNQRLIVISEENENGDIDVFISGVRPKGKVGEVKKGEGDHVTAYTNFLEMICTAVEGESIREIPGRIAKLAECVLPHKKVIFEEILEKLQAKQADYLSSTDRREITYVLRAVQKLIDKDLLSTALKQFPTESRMLFAERVGQHSSDNSIAKQRRTVKAAEKHAISQAISAIGTQMINALQKEWDIAFDKTPKAQQTKEQQAAAKTEGSRIRMAAYALKALDRLLQLNVLLDAEQKTPKTELAEVTRGEQLTFGFIKDLEVKNSSLKSGLKVLASAFVDTTGKSKAAIDEAAKTRLEAWLTPLNQSKKTEQHLKAMRELCAHVLNPETHSQLADKVGDLFEDMFDFSYGVHREDDEVEDMVYRLTARHVVVLFNAFQHLQTLERPMQQQIINCFISNGLLAEKKEGWNQYQDEEGQVVLPLETAAWWPELERYAKLGSSQDKNAFEMLLKPRMVVDITAEDDASTSPSPS